MHVRHAMAHVHVHVHGRAASEVLVNAKAKEGIEKAISLSENNTQRGRKIASICVADELTTKEGLRSHYMSESGDCWRAIEHILAMPSRGG